MNKLLIASLLLLAACSPTGPINSDPRTVHNVDPILQPYVNYYTTYKGSSLAYDVPMGFANLTYPVVGMCTIWSNGYRQIQIDQTYWNASDEGARQEVIFHELGHCDLNRAHVCIVSGGYCTSSIMYPYVFELTSSNIASLIIELFSANVPLLTNGSASDDADCVQYIKVE